MNKIDAKGRVSIPAVFRRVLCNLDKDYDSETNKTPRIHIIYGDSSKPFLLCLSARRMDTVSKKIETSHFTGRKRDLLRFVFNKGNFSTTVDEGGRLLLPAHVRQAKKLHGQAMFCGAGDSFEIWPPYAYEKQRQKMDECLGNPSMLDDESEQDWDISNLLVEE